MGHYYLPLLPSESPPPSTGIYVTGRFPFPDFDSENHLCSMCLCVDFSRGFLDLSYYASGGAYMRLSASPDEVLTGWGDALHGTFFCYSHHPTTRDILRLLEAGRYMTVVNRNLRPQPFLCDLWLVRPHLMEFGNPYTRRLNDDMEGVLLNWTGIEVFTGDNST